MANLGGSRSIYESDHMERLLLAHVSPIEKRADRYAHALSSRRSGRGSGATQGVAFCRAAGERNPQPEYLRKPTEDVKILSFRVGSLDPCGVIPRSRLCIPEGPTVWCLPKRMDSHRASLGKEE